jgi:hypothetical protein
VSKKLEEKQRRRAAEEQRKSELARATRRRNLITAGIALVVAVAVVILVVTGNGEDSSDASYGVAKSEANCSEIRDSEVASRQHVDAGTDVQYETSPPVGGDHWPPEAIADTGFYTSPVAEESLVHNQEHGQIVIWYNPDAPQGVKDDLEKATDEERIATTTVPYDDIESPYNFALTAWEGGDGGEDDAGTGHTQFCELVSRQVINDFRRAYQGNGPEPITPPFNG